jgi:hypothetical protein
MSEIIKPGDKPKPKLTIIRSEERIIDRMLMPFMLEMVLRSLQKMVEVRSDMFILLERAQGRDMEDLDPIIRRRVAQKVQDEGMAILRCSANPKLTTLLVALSRIVLKMESEGVYFTENVILIASEFILEFNEDPASAGGENEVNRLYGILLNEAHRRGWLRPVIIQN